MALQDELIRAFNQLTEDQQQHVVDYTKSLQQHALPPGTPGEVLLAKMGTFAITAEDLDEMEQVIEEWCERVDWDEWK